MGALEITGVDKRYGGVHALRDASLTVRAGEIHALLGPNGSGKSTLNKVIAGAVRPDRAVLRVGGREVVVHSPRAAHALGIDSVYQQLSLVPHLSVRENLLLGTEAARLGWLTPGAQRAAVDDLLARMAPVLQSGVKANSRTSGLLPGTLQLLEFAKAVLRRPRFLILDEATASLHRGQVALLFEIVRELAADGVGIVFVSHRLGEVFALADRATVIRNGENIATVDLATTDERALVGLVVGEIVEAAQRVEREPGHIGAEPVLAAEGVTAPGVHGIDLEVRPGEILGLGGLQGQGQSELLMALFGAVRMEAGRVLVHGRPIRRHGPRGAIAAGIALVPGDRGTEGLYMPRSIQENISTVTLRRRALAGFALSPRAERRAAQSQVDALRIKIGGLGDPVRTLSGGNAQKVVIAKWLLSEPDVVLLDDPTKGVDVGAKAEIYAIIRALTDRGVGVLLNSSDDVELAELADRVLVLYEGQVVDELTGVRVTRDALVTAALRVREDDPSGPDPSGPDPSGPDPSGSSPSGPGSSDRDPSGRDSTEQVPS